MAVNVEQRIYAFLTQDKLKDFCDGATGLQSSVPLRRAFAGRHGVGCDDVYEESRAIAAGRGVHSIHGETVASASRIGSPANSRLFSVVNYFNDPRSITNRNRTSPLRTRS